MSDSLEAGRAGRCAGKEADDELSVDAPGSVEGLLQRLLLNATVDLDFDAYHGRDAIGARV